MVIEKSSWAGESGERGTIERPNLEALIVAGDG
jgi:hypothetical protein